MILVVIIIWRKGVHEHLELIWQLHSSLLANSETRNILNKQWLVLVWENISRTFWAFGCVSRDSSVYVIAVQHVNSLAAEQTRSMSSGRNIYFARVNIHVASLFVFFNIGTFQEGYKTCRPFNVSTCIVYLWCSTICTGCPKRKTESNF